MVIPFGLCFLLDPREILTGGYGGVEVTKLFCRYEDLVHVLVRFVSVLVHYKRGYMHIYLCLSTEGLQD